jgi:hypothetical protein
MTADYADEGAALGAGITFRGAFLAATGPTFHCIMFVKLGHIGSGGDAVALDLVDQGCAGDAQLDGCPSAVAAVVLQGTLDMLPLEILETEWSVTTVAQARAGTELAR